MKRTSLSQNSCSIAVFQLNFFPCFKNFCPTIIFCFLRKRTDALRKKNHTLLPREGQDGVIQSVRSEKNSRPMPSTDVIVQNAHRLQTAKMCVKIPSYFTSINFFVLPFSISGMIMGKLSHTARETNRTECISNIFLNQQQNIVTSNSVSENYFSRATKSIFLRNK